ncbi:hypothetical protein FA95DRAFT_1461092, partial [Auriscalpium vulgare]
SSNRVYNSKPFCFFITVDRPGLSQLDGKVPHNGARGCRIYYPAKGRHRFQQSTYYPALLKPMNYHIAGSDHPDINVAALI